MIKSFEELKVELDKIETKDLEALIFEQMELKLSDCGEALCEWLKVKAESLIPDIVNLAPEGNYDQLMEEPDAILHYLQDEACKPENWRLTRIECHKPEDKVLQFSFENKVVDEGDSLRGFVFVGFSGTIRHAFCQAFN